MRLASALLSSSFNIITNFTVGAFWKVRQRVVTISRGAEDESIFLFGPARDAAASLAQDLAGVLWIGHLLLKPTREEQNPQDLSFLLG